MPLIKYATYVFLPGGNPAPNLPVPVYLAGGNQLVPLRADKAGTTPLSNPPTTDGDGLLVFYAPPGDYTSWISGSPVLLTVAEDETDESWPGLFIHDQSTPSSLWSVQHYFGVRPTVSIMVDNTESEAQVSHTDDNTTVITFSQTVTGTAYLRR